jgi:hypothetical protein
VSADDDGCVLSYGCNNLRIVEVMQMSHCRLGPHRVAESRIGCCTFAQELRTFMQAHARHGFAGFDLAREHVHVEAVLSKCPRARDDMRRNPTISGPVWSYKQYRTRILRHLDHIARCLRSTSVPLRSRSIMLVEIIANA